jgi:5S rRNA maturation endonuclease (ribonuclease M5)
MELKQLKTYLNENAESVFDKLGMKCEIFGDNIYSTCPAHEGSDNPRAFSFSKTKGVWKCWTKECQKEHKNDIFGLIVGTLSHQCGQDLEFKDALKWINNTFHRKANNKHVENEDVYADFTNLIEFFTQNTNIKQDKVVDLPFTTCNKSNYFMDRGFKNETLEYFNVKDSLETGIMKDRAIIPIHNDFGDKIVGCIGRSMKEYRLPKFLFYPKGLDKRYYLYNYHRAVSKAITTSCLYIVEGQGDVWKLYESGVHNAVSLFGKTLSEEQLEKLNKLPITKLILIMDNDQAGKEARIQLHRQLNRSYKLVFPRLSAKDLGDMSTKDIKSQILSKLQGTY